jgi:hypothetical protein
MEKQVENALFCPIPEESQYIFWLCTLCSVAKAAMAHRR